MVDLQVSQIHEYSKQKLAPSHFSLFRIKVYTWLPLSSATSYWWDTLYMIHLHKLSKEGNNVYTVCKRILLRAYISINLRISWSVWGLRVDTGIHPFTCIMNMCKNFIVTHFFISK